MRRGFLACLLVGLTLLVAPACGSSGKTAGGGGAGATTTTGASSGASQPAEQVISVTVRGTQVAAKESYRVPVGAPVRIQVTGNVTDEVHVHGYNIMKELSPKTPAVITFRATIAGEFEVELENAHHRLFVLRVS